MTRFSTLALLPSPFPHVDRCGAVHSTHGNNDRAAEYDITSRRDVLRRTSASLLASTLWAPPAAVAGPPEPSAAGPSRMREAKMVMRLLALRGSVPQHYVSDFRTALEGFGIAAIQYKPSLSDLWGELEGNKKNKYVRTTVDAITVGDASLDDAIARGLVQPVDAPQRHRYWRALNGRWRRLASRGEHVYGIPYRWGCTIIVFRKDRLQRYRDGGLRLVDWDDLLDPRLEKKIAFMSSPREMVGIALKTFGLGYVMEPMFARPHPRTARTPSGPSLQSRSHFVPTHTPATTRPPRTQNTVAYRRRTCEKGFPASFPRPRSSATGTTCAHTPPEMLTSSSAALTT